MATVQIRNLDDDAYATLKARASASGRSLQEYLRRVLEEQASRPTVSERLSQARSEMAWGVDDPDVTMDDVVAVQRELRSR